MDAKSAREMAEKFNNSAVAEQWVKVKKHICEAAKKEK